MTLLLLHAGTQIIGSAPPPAFEVDAVTMDDGDWISGNQTITDGPEGSFVLWVKINLPTAVQIGLFSNVDSYFGIGLTDSGNVSNTYFYNSAATLFFQLIGATPIPDDSWIPIFVSWKTNLTAGNKLGNFYAGDVDIGTVFSDSDGSFSVGYDNQPFFVGRHDFENYNFVGDMAECWFDDSYIDFSVEANRRLFYSATGKPVDLGSDGSTPTGSQPIIYLSVRPGDVAADFATNRGSGGNFTQNGTLAVASTSPSD